MNIYPKFILLMLGLLLSPWSFSAHAKDADAAFWPADVVSWRTHRGGIYDFSLKPPEKKGEPCYRTSFFGDSICAGFNNQNPFSGLRSFCENMAIRFSANNNDIITKYENFSKVGATAEEILNKMKKSQESIHRAHLIAWESGGNDTLWARKAFRDRSNKSHYCRQCILDNELGNPLATGPDPRCKDIVGVLQKYKSVQKETISFLKENANPSAIIRVMGLYYPLLAEDKVHDLNCTDPDTNQN
ncbi:MAG: SGNH/GDSL hydrolase family protein, partial [Bdellovibrionia bacterium]